MWLGLVFLEGVEESGNSLGIVWTPDLSGCVRVWGKTLSRNVMQEYNSFFKLSSQVFKSCDCQILIQFSKFLCQSTVYLLPVINRTQMLVGLLYASFPSSTLVSQATARTHFCSLPEVQTAAFQLASFPGSPALEHKHWSCTGVESVVFFSHVSR